MFSPANQDLKNKMKRLEIRHWMVAYKLKISPETFSRWLRIDLSVEKKNMILAAISELVKERDLKEVDLDGQTQ